jgi:hypothetical protein
MNLSPAPLTRFPQLTLFIQLLGKVVLATLAKLVTVELPVKEIYYKQGLKTA